MLMLILLMAEIILYVNLFVYLTLSRARTHFIVRDYPTSELILVLEIIPFQAYYFSISVLCIHSHY